MPLRKEIVNLVVDYLEELCPDLPGDDLEEAACEIVDAVLNYQGYGDDDDPDDTEGVSEYVA